MPPVKRKRPSQRSHDPSSPSAQRLSLTSSSSSHLPPHASGSLIQLEPLRQHFHHFLADATAARLLQTSRAIAQSLLDGYAFAGHVFTFPSAAAMDRTCALYTRYNMRVRRLCLPAATRGEGKPPELPPSLLCLALAPVQCWASEQHPCMLLDGCDPLRCTEVEEEDEADEAADDDAAFSWRMRRVETMRRTWELYDFGACHGQFNGRLKASTLPHGLRFLQLNDSYKWPLRAGSVPDSVQVMQLGRLFDKPLQVGSLPTSLVYLVLNDQYHHTLLPGVLPTGLQHLKFGRSYNTELLPGALPSFLERISFGKDWNRPIMPGVIPPPVRYLRLSQLFNQPLYAGSIPHGVTHLNLGAKFDHPLMPGVLPSSLRELIISCNFVQPLQPGSLPDGVEVVVFTAWGVFQQPLLPGIIPASVVLLSMPRMYRLEVVAGSIPATVKWLRVSRDRSEGDVRAVLSPSTRLIWWEDYVRDSSDESDDDGESEHSDQEIEEGKEEEEEKSDSDDAEYRPWQPRWQESC